MWEMIDSDLECGNECWGPGPPPNFLIPPPPRPPFLQELSKCTEDPLPDIEMCEAIPMLDASYHSSPSLQTSAMIVISSILLVLVVLMTTFFAWKHKRKVQNFLPCKTPTRGAHLDGTGVSGGHSVTYEDPDSHLGRRPLVMRHHNMEMLHSKNIHFPSGYPMPRSPPLFVCSSPGPDPYRSHDNVYEELGPPHDSDGESEPPIHSDDDFAEDELSLPGERSFQKLKTDQPATPIVPVATIYHERNTSSSLLDRGQNERNSLLSSSSSNNNERIGILRSSVSPDSGLFRSRKIHNSRGNGKIRNYSADELNTSSEQTSSDVVPTIYDDRNLMTLPYSHNHNSCNSNSNNVNHSNSNSNSNCNNINNNIRHHSINCFTSSNDASGGDSEVERRNRINAQLSKKSVSTIFRGRILNNRGFPPQPQQYHNNHGSNHRSRTNPRSLDRRRIGNVPAPHEQSYGYAEPVFHEGILYDACLSHQLDDRNHLYPYILPEFTTFRNLNNTDNGGVGGGCDSGANANGQHQQQLQQQLLQPIYSRDSSFGSDSGYSHHTQTSNRGGGAGVCSTTTSNGGGSVVGNGNSGSSGIGCGWGRRKDNSNNNKSRTYDCS